MPWATRLFVKSMKGKILNFLHEVEKVILVIFIQVYSENWDFPFFLNKPHFQGIKVNFYFLTTYGVCKKRTYCNRMGEKKILSF